MKRLLLSTLCALGTIASAACSDDQFVATNESDGGEAGKSTGGSVSSGGSVSTAGASFGGGGGASGQSGTAGQSGAAGAGGGGTECNPGDKQDVGTCEKCGTSRRTCDASGHWGTPACEGQGECTPGQKSTDGCGDPCADKVCGQNCTWNACAKKDGATCLWQNGSNFQCCGADHWQFCNSSTCDWFACQPCETGSSCFSAC